jgi:glycosyltransferase involved in cell wall biosynthesis
VDEVVVPSRASAALMQQLGVDPELITVVPYGVPDEAQRPLPSRDAILLEDLRRRWTLVLGCLGTIGERKNQRLVIDALAQVRGVVAGCVFIGDGDAAGLAAYARTRGVGDRTVVLGYRPEACQYLRRTDASVMASRSEGLPLAILEAFRDGVPVLAADIDELREVVTHGVTGLLFAPEDARSLAAAIESAACGGARSVAANARAEYESRYTVSRMVSGYGEVYARARHRHEPVQAS